MIYNTLIYFLFKLIHRLSSSLKPLLLIFFIAYILSYLGIAEKSESLGENTYRYIWFLAFENLFVAIPGELAGSYSTFANFMVYITLFSAILSKLFKGALHSKRIEIVTKINHSIVIGLGENNRRYLNSELSFGNENKIVIIESNKNNIHIEEFKDKGFVVFIGTLDTYKINYKTLEHVVISTGNDRMNIEVAGMLINKIPKDMSKDKFGNATVVYVHLNNSNYKALFQQKILSVNNNLPLEFKVYSFYENAVKELFERHTILGNYHNIASSSSSYNIILVGDGSLAEVMVYHLCLLSSLPNNNHLTIYIVWEKIQQNSFKNYM